MLLFGPPNIGKLKSKKNVLGLIKALEYPKRQKIRAQAAEALGDLGDPQAVEPLLARLANEDLQDAASLVSALGKLRDPRAIPVLIGRIKKEGVTGGTQELSALLLIGDPAVPHLLELLAETSKETRQALRVIEILEKIGSPSTFRGMKDFLSLKTPNLIPHLVDTFVKMGNDQTIPLLVSLLEQGPAEPWAAHVVEGLLQLGWQPESDLEKTAKYLAHRDWKKLAELGTFAVEFVIPLLRNSRAEIILQAVETLGKISDDRSVEPVARLLEDRRPEIAAAAAHALGEIGSEQAVEPLLQALLTVGHAAVQNEAKTALIRIGTLAVPYLISCLESMDPQERCLSIVLLGEISDKRAVLPLKTQLQSKDLREQKAAILSLGQMGDPQAVESLVVLLDHPALEADVQWALSRLGWVSDRS